MSHFWGLQILPLRFAAILFILFSVLYNKRICLLRNSFLNFTIECLFDESGGEELLEGEGETVAPIDDVESLFADDLLPDLLGHVVGIEGVAIAGERLFRGMGGEGSGDLAGKRGEEESVWIGEER
jgi:hypothetical protein